MFEVAPWKSTTRRMFGTGLGGMWTISSRGSPSTVMWCTAVPGAKPAPRTHRVATPVVVGVLCAAGVVVVGPLAFGVLELHAANAAATVPTVNAAAMRRIAVIAARRARRRLARWFRDARHPATPSAARRVRAS